MSIETQANAVRDMLMAEIDKSRTIVFDGLLNTPPMNSIPESLFVNYFLPCFLGNPTNPNWVMEWISIAGTAMSEVGVFSDATREFLFTVPSLLNSNNLYLHKQAGDLGDIFGRYDQITNNTPTRGLGFLLEALNSKNKELLHNLSFNEVNQKWYQILARYKVIQPEQQLNPVSGNNSEDDMFEI